jgi:nicotinic acid phosphoribosyltransferase
VQFKYGRINYSHILQGDGIGYEQIKKILEVVLENKFSAQNVAFGMGGGLLQKVNRDTMSFATKLMYIKYAGMFRTFYCCCHHHFYLL